MMSSKIHGWKWLEYVRIPPEWFQIYAPEARIAGKPMEKNQEFQLTSIHLHQFHPWPIGSMYGIFTYIYHKNQPNVGKLW